MMRNIARPNGVPLAKVVRYGVYGGLAVSVMLTSQYWSPVLAQALVGLGRFLGALFVTLLLTATLFGLFCPWAVDFRHGLGGGWSWGVGYKTGGWRSHNFTLGPYSVGLNFYRGPRSSRCHMPDQERPPRPARAEEDTT